MKEVARCLIRHATINVDVRLIYNSLANINCVVDSKSTKKIITLTLVEV